MTFMVFGPAEEKAAAEDVLPDYGHSVFVPDPVTPSEPDAVLLTTSASKAEWFRGGFWRGRGKMLAVIGSGNDRKALLRELGAIRLDAPGALAAWLADPRPL